MATTIPPNYAAFCLDEIQSATRGALLVSGKTHSVGVTTDTRTLQADNLFIALLGERFDGHEYLERAIAGQAAILIVEHCPQVQRLILHLSQQNAQERPSLIAVSDTLRALGDLGHVHRRRIQCDVIAVVGSAGKTTTRSVISALLEAERPGKIHSTLGNLNNRIGVPMTLFGLSDNHECAVVELGTNCPGEIDILAKMTEPQAAILTLIDLEHTEGLVDLDGVEKEESAVFEHLTGPALAIGYGDDVRVLRSLSASQSKASLSYGEEQGRDLRIVSRELITPTSLSLSLVRKDGSTLSFESPLIGRAGALAVAAGVLAVESLFGQRLSGARCESALKDAGEPGRHTLVSLGLGRWVMDDSYNSNPASVAMSIAAGQELSQKSGGRLWLVLGEMLELGDLSEKAHRSMGHAAGMSGAAGAFFVQGAALHAAEVARPMLDKVEFFESAALVAPSLVPLLGKGDIVVVKASRGVRAERVVQDLQNAFPNRQCR